MRSVPSLDQREKAVTRLDRSRTFRLVFLGLLVLAAMSCSREPRQAPAPGQTAKTTPVTAQQVAKTFGIHSLTQIDAIRYTGNGELPGINISRTWTWEPKKDQVSYEGKDKDGKPVKATYVRSQLKSQHEIGR